MRDNHEAYSAIVNETIQSLTIPNYVPAHHSDFFLKALNRLLSLLNEAPVKNRQRNAMKREPTESPDDEPSKTLTISATDISDPFKFRVKKMTLKRTNRIWRRKMLNTAHLILPGVFEMSIAGEAQKPKSQPAVTHLRTSETNRPSEGDSYTHYTTVFKGRSRSPRHRSRPAHVESRKGRL